MKKLRKKLSRVIGLVLAMAMMLSVGTGVMAEDGNTFNSPCDDDVFNVLTEEEKAINDALCDELVSLGKSIKHQRGYGDAKTLNVPTHRQCGSGLDKYKSIYMEDLHLSIWYSGCTLTSFTMAADYANKPNSNSVESVNARMGNNACKSGGVGFDYWAARNSFGFSNVAVASASSTQHMYDFVCGALLSNQPAIIGFRKPNGDTHFVTAYTYVYMDMSNPPHVGIIDPNGFDNYTNVSQLLSMGWTPYQLVSYSA